MIPAGIAGTGGIDKMKDGAFHKPFTEEPFPIPSSDQSWVMLNMTCGPIAIQ
jgi:hypothetical protein